MHKKHSGTDRQRRFEFRGFSGNLLKVYSDIYEEIKQGYADGTREVWTADNSAENGYRKVSEEEELAGEF